MEPRAKWDVVLSGLPVNAMKGPSDCKGWMSVSLEVSNEILNSGFGFFILLLSLFNFPYKMTFCPRHVIPIMLQVTQMDYL